MAKDDELDLRAQCQLSDQGDLQNSLFQWPCSLFLGLWIYSEVILDVWKDFIDKLYSLDHSRFFILGLFHSKRDFRFPTLPCFLLNKRRNGALLSHKVTCQILHTTLEEWDDLSSTAQYAKYQEATGVYDILYYANLNDTGKVFYIVFECAPVPYAFADKYWRYYIQ